jgi:hypothetical protein
VHREYPASRNTKGLVDDPVPEIIPRPEAIFPGFVFTDDEPFEKDCGNGRDDTS